MRMRGALDEAERDVALACADLLVSNPHNAGFAFGELGEIRRRRGDRDGATAAFRRAIELGCDPQPGLALLRLDQHDATGALRSIERGLSETSVLGMERRPPLLPAAVRIALAAGDHERARRWSDELDEAARTFSTEIFAATACEARGRLALASRDADAAARALRDAVRQLCELDVPFEAAEARLELADAYEMLGDRWSAELELDAAAATFARLGVAVDRLRTRHAPARATRTFLFSDIVDSTRLVELLGDDAWGDLLAWHDRTMRAVITAHGGTEVDHTGDGFFVAFTDARVASECAIAMQRALHDHRREHGFAPSVRIGVHAGEAFTRGDNFGGRDVHVAARIAGAAGAGEILASVASVPTLTSADGETPVRRIDLKGFSEPVDVVAVPWR
jgi:class 3 adenylate cyclase